MNLGEVIEGDKRRAKDPILFTFYFANNKPITFYVPQQMDYVLSEDSDAVHIETKDESLRIAKAHLIATAASTEKGIR